MKKFLSLLLALTLVLSMAACNGGNGASSNPGLGGKGVANLLPHTGVGFLIAGGQGGHSDGHVLGGGLARYLKTSAK